MSESEISIGGGRAALVVTVSDGVTSGVRQDVSGVELAERLAALGFRVERTTAPDEAREIAALLERETDRNDVIVTTGGTGLTPRDVTPQATSSIVEYEIPGFGELMRAAGARSTPMAYLSRSMAGVLRRCLIVNVPGSPRAAMESLAAIEPLLDHAMTTIAGPYDHDAEGPPRSSR